MPLGAYTSHLLGHPSGADSRDPKAFCPTAARFRVGGTTAASHHGDPEVLTVDDDLIDGPNRTAFVMVGGDSMKNTGLMDGVHLRSE